ncbi:MAG: hypothetical protein LBL44_09900 [Treponema sp.]|jgi:hypothetical protein|nr:hypothetical protein [Treponema sp.]
MPSSITREAGAVQVEEMGRHGLKKEFTEKSKKLKKLKKTGKKKNHGQNGQDGHFEAACFEERIYRKVEEVEEVEEEGKKK